MLRHYRFDVPARWFLFCHQSITGILADNMDVGSSCELGQQQCPRLVYPDVECPRYWFEKDCDRISKPCAKSCKQHTHYGTREHVLCNRSFISVNTSPRWPQNKVWQPGEEEATPRSAARGNSHCPSSHLNPGRYNSYEYRCHHAYTQDHATKVAGLSYDTIFKCWLCTRVKDALSQYHRPMHMKMSCI